MDFPRRSCDDGVSVCAPLCCKQKPCAVRPVFARVVGTLGVADPRICSKGHEEEQMPRQGHTLRLLDEAWEAGLGAQCSATPASVAATPPCSATPFQRQLDVRHPWQLKGDRCDRAF